MKRGSIEGDLLLTEVLAADLDIAVVLCLALGGVAVCLLAYMIFVEPLRIQVREIELAFPNLPGAFDGYTILHLSDLHSTGLKALEKRVMGLIAGREVDTCVVTGDATADPQASDVLRRVCSVVAHRDPIYLVLGNSEHKPWINTTELVRQMSFDGLKALNNTSDLVRRDGAWISIVGLDDPYTRNDDIEKAFRGVDSAGFVLLLVHCPSVAPQGIRMGADLILSGHTHGGQVRFPGLGPVFTHMRSNKALNGGLYEPDDLARILRTDPGHSVLFVTRGIGTSRLPIRFRCRPEIAYIVLRRSAAG